MNLKHFQISLRIFYPHKVYLLMASGLENVITDTEITVKPQFLRFHSKFRVAENDVIGVIPCHTLLILTQ